MLNKDKEKGTGIGAVLPSTHIISVDLEDYFMVEAFASSVSPDSWGSRPSRVVMSTLRVLDLFDEYSVKGTFFFVGWVAHRIVYSQTPDEFREDTRPAVRAIEDTAAIKVFGCRAPSWSIAKDCLWVLDVLAEEGFRYDSSIYPIHHDLYGVPGARRFPYTHRLKDGHSLLEFPPAAERLLGQNLPCAGGGYLRKFPLAYTHWVFRRFQEDYGESVVVYFHPWELDPDQPRIQEKLKSRLRHYTNLDGMKNRLELLLQTYSFQPFCEVAGVGEGPALQTLGDGENCQGVTRQ